MINANKTLFLRFFLGQNPFNCILRKSIGGKWDEVPDNMMKWCETQGNCETWPHMDGVKRLCMDQLYENVKSNSCLIYSFGLSGDWSFEENMALLGCKVEFVYFS